MVVWREISSDNETDRDGGLGEVRAVLDGGVVS